METEIVQIQKACSLYAWGTRQSMSTPGQPFQIYGGSTACYGVVLDGAATLVLEAGFGLRYVPVSFWENAHHLLVSSVQWDKIQGIPFTPSVYNPKLSFHLTGPKPPDRDFAEALLDQQRPELCPVPNFYQDGIGATFELTSFSPSSTQQSLKVFGQDLVVWGDGRACIQLEYGSVAYFPSGFGPDSATECATVLVGMPAQLKPGQEAQWLEGCRLFLSGNPKVQRILVCNYLSWQDDALLASLESEAAGFLPMEFLRQGKQSQF